MLTPGQSLSAKSFWQSFIQEMNDLWCTDFQLHYNNNEKSRKSRNARPRSTLMVGNKGSVIDKVIGSLRVSNALPEGELAYTRYIDASYSSGDWYKGEKGTHLAVEVENDFGELRGTLRDLFHFQAHVKVAIFYASDPETKEDEVEQAVHEVARSFARDGFLESPETQYLIIVAPDDCPEECSHPGATCSALEFTGTVPPDRISRLHETLWSRAKRSN